MEVGKEAAHKFDWKCVFQGVASVETKRVFWACYKTQAGRSEKESWRCALMGGSNDGANEGTTKFWLKKKKILVLVSFQELGGLGHTNPTRFDAGE